MDINLPLILLAALIAGGSPGPATLAIAGTAMASGRRAALALAAGITTGSLTWSVAAALGLGAIMLAHAWLFEIIRYAGAAYLLYLAWKSARSALSRKPQALRPVAGPLSALYAKGLLLHLTNPKAILFFGALYSMGVSPQASAWDLALVIVAVGLQSALIFHGYALLFAAPALTRAYMRLRRMFDALFALGFGLAGVRVLFARLT